MKKALTFGLLACGLLFAMASATPAEDTDAGDSRRDAGSTDTNSGFDANSGTDAGAGTWSVNNYGATCTSDSQCPGGKCYNLFGAASGAASACFKLCDTAANCSDFPYNVSAVQCGALEEGGPGVCVMSSGQNGPCGNPFNATCSEEDYSLCGTDSSGFGTCVRVCNPHDPTNVDGCRVTGITSANCGCSGGDGCSANLLGFTSSVEGDPDGVCAPTTTVGDTCGYSETTYVLTPCTDDQECDGLSDTSSTGLCAEPSADAGVAEDAG